MVMGRRALKWLLNLAGLCVTVLATIVLVFAFQARVRLADLHAWHEISLAEFHAGRADAPKTFVEYRALEDRLFAELRRKVLDDPAAADTQLLGRYTPIRDVFFVVIAGAIFAGITAWLVVERTL